MRRRSLPGQIQAPVRHAGRRRRDGPARRARAGQRAAAPPGGRRGYGRRPRPGGAHLVLRKADARLPKGRYFIDDLLGCTVKDAGTGAVYGTITAVDQPAAHDVYTVRDAAGAEHLFPAVPEFLDRIDIEARTVTVRPIPGMFTDAVSGDEE